MVEGRWLDMACELSVGANRYTRVLARLVLKASGRDNIRFFGLEEEAVAWLKAES